MAYESLTLRKAIFVPIIHIFQSDVFKVLLILLSVVTFYQFCMTITAHALQGGIYKQTFANKGAQQSPSVMPLLQNAYTNPQESSFGSNNLQPANQFSE